MTCRLAFPAEPTLHVRRSSPYTTVPFRRAQILEQTRQGEQVLGSEQRPAGGHDHKEIGLFHVGPGCRKRVDTLTSRLAEEHSVLAPGVGEADQLELLAFQGVERVGDAEPLLIAARLSS